MNILTPFRSFVNAFFIYVQNLMMSHPFTLEYMQEGETSSNEISRDIVEGSLAHRNQGNLRQSARNCDNESVTDGCGKDQIEKKSRRRHGNH